MSSAEEFSNQKLFKETLATEFPEEDMKDKHFRDKVGGAWVVISHHSEILPVFRTKNLH